MKYIFLFLFLPLYSFPQQFSKEEIARFESEAKQVTIIRDTWGIPHIYGKTDADAVFGLLYAQCEDDFNRVEMNALENLGRIAEVNGENNLYDDLKMRLIYDSVAAINDYKKSPAWFKKLLDASADGVNYFLYKHLEIKPSALHRFQPWYSLMRTNGSISATNTGGVSVQETKNFYTNNNVLAPINKTSFIKSEEDHQNVTGSNGFAVAPSKTKNKNAILYINPHVTFYFRSEVHMVSDEGLNVYGAVTWGQFFIFQGFNEHCGWMHTSGVADLADLYQEKIIKKDNQLFYKYDNTLKPVRSKQITISYKKDGLEIPQTFTAYFTHHGPVMADRNGWLSLKENNRSLKGLIQSWLRTKAKSFTEFEKVMEMRSNTSDNTVYADDKGNIAYWHGNFIPIRDTKYDWSQPVDGTTSATEWKGIHKLNDIVHVHNPSTGFIQNCNSTPFTVSGTASPDKNKYPKYMSPDGENPRAINAVRLLSNENNFTLDKMMETGYNTYLSAFDILLPSLFTAYDTRLITAVMNPIDQSIYLLKKWDKRSSASSVATTLAIEWATKLSQKISPPKNEEEKTHLIARLEEMTKTVSAKEKIQLMEDILAELQNNFGTWEVKWGDMNRYQRLTSDLKQNFDDTKTSMPVGMASSAWGCIPSFSTIKPQGLKHRYGVNGNSFVAAVEFGKKVKAKSIVTGGEATDPLSKHFRDQSQMYIDGKFKDVLFYKEDVLKKVERKYHPGSPL